MVEALYSLPFDTSKYPVRISQGNNGPWSHFRAKKDNPFFPGRFIETDMVYAVDFALPIGTEVKAARGGKILMAYLNGGWVYRGLDPEVGNSQPGRTNYIQIDHGDGTVALYSHLSREVLVQRKQEVSAGEVIALTGESGWIAEIPHMHFQVNDRSFRRTLPLSFRDYHGSLDHKTLVKEGQIWFGEGTKQGGETK